METRHTAKEWITTLWASLKPMRKPSQRAAGFPEGSVTETCDCVECNGDKKIVGHKEGHEMFRIKLKAIIMACKADGRASRSEIREVVKAISEKDHITLECKAQNKKKSPHERKLAEKAKEEALRKLERR